MSTVFVLSLKYLSSEISQVVNMLKTEFMLFTMIYVVIFLISGCLCDVSHLIQYGENLETTPIPPPIPYNFHYKAGRFPGQIDRYQSESGDGNGVVHGTYSFIDPKFKIRTVDYTADKNGFHPVLTNYEDIMAQPQDTEAVKLEKQRHYTLYSKIASEHQAIGSERESKRLFSGSSI